VLLLGKGAAWKQEIGEACITFCPACGARLAWERSAGETHQCWLGRCACGALRVLHLHTLVEQEHS
jgi:hypothetical protein